jgi:outer membrane protein TolC
MLIRRALALSALVVATAFAGDKLALQPEEDAGPTLIITLHDAIAMALKDNIDILWHKTDIKLQDTQIRLAWGDFDPALSLDSTYEFARTPQNPTTITTADTAQQILLEQEALAEIQTAVNALPTPVPLPSSGPTATPAASITPSTKPYIFQNEDIRNSLNLQGKLPTGTTYKVGMEMDHLRDTVLGLNQNFLPSDVFFAGLTIDQPMLQGLGYDANMASIRIGRRNRQVSYNNWRQSVIDTVGQVMAAYIDMNFAQQVIKVRSEAKAADETLVDANQRRVDVGLMTPIDVREAEAQVSSDLEDILTAQDLLSARREDLKKRVYRDVQEDDGGVFQAAGPASIAVPVLDRESLLADAFRNRVDYATALEQADIENVRLKYYKNQVLPRIDFVATLGVNGLSTQSTASSVSDSGQGPEWMFGIQGSIPLGNVAARANLAASHRLREEAVWKVKQVELAVNTDVDGAISIVHTNEERVQTARQARVLAEDVVRMQDRRIEVGQASTLDILASRRLLHDAQARELGAVADLDKAVVQLYLSTGTLLRQEGIGLVDDEPDSPRVRAAKANPAPQ